MKNARPPSRRVVHLLVALQLSCSGGDPGDAESDPGPPGSIPGAFFEDVSAGSGVEFRFVNGARGRRILLESLAGGLGWIDHDGDGDQDLYVVNGHSDPLRAALPGAQSNRLFRNDGSGKFTDVTEEAGVGDRRYGFGLAVGDYDSDGHQDLFVTNFGRNTLYRNRGDGTFVDVTEQAGLREEGWSMSAAWFDMDGDRDLDLYVVQYLVYYPGLSRDCEENGQGVHCHPRLFAGAPDLLYENRGDGSFVEIGSRAGIDRAGSHEGKGLGLVVFDQDRDGHVDVYVANDTTANFLWRSGGDGTFRDVGQEVGVALSPDGKSQAGMGVDVGDCNSDGYSDLYVTNFGSELNALYTGGEDAVFEDRIRSAGLASTYAPLGFGTLLLDVDLDGDEDIVTANGHVNDVVEITDPRQQTTYRQSMALHVNDGDGHFEDASARAGDFFSTRVVGRALASCDFDGDRAPDLAVLTQDRSVVLLRNRNPLDHRGIVVRLLTGDGRREAYGARVEARAGGRSRVFEYQSARSYLSACDPRVVIGLGEHDHLDLLRVSWPGGRTTERRRVPAGESLVLEEPR